MPQAAQAGAWLMPEDHGQIVVTGSASAASDAFDNEGHSKSTPRYTKTELQALIEYGVTDWLTAMAIPGLQHVGIAHNWWQCIADVGRKADRLVRGQGGNLLDRALHHLAHGACAAHQGRAAQLFDTADVQHVVDDAQQHFPVAPAER